MLAVLFLAKRGVTILFWVSDGFLTYPLFRYVRHGVVQLW